MATAANKSNADMVVTYENPVTLPSEDLTKGTRSNFNSATGSLDLTTKIDLDDDDTTTSRMELGQLHNAITRALFGAEEGNHGGVGMLKTDLQYRIRWFGLLHKETNIRHAYDAFHMVILCYFLFILPYRIGFRSEPQGMGLIIDLWIDVSLAIDIFIQAHTYYKAPDTGLMVYDQKMIYKHYLKTWFAVDLLTVIPFDQMFRLISLMSNSPQFKSDLASVANQVRVLKMGRLLKLGRLKELVNPKKLSSLLAVLLKPLGIMGVELRTIFYMRVFVLVCVLLSICHILGCYWVRVGYDGMVLRDEGWIVTCTNLTLEETDTDAGRDIIYTHAIYFILVTMSSTGYGDIHANSDVEQRTVSTIIVAGVFVIAYIVGCFGMMIANIASDHNRFDSKMRSVGALVDGLGAPQELKLRVQEFYLSKYQNATLFDDSLLYDELPGNLRREVIRARYGILESIPWLHGALHNNDRLFMSVCARITEYSIMPGDIICRRGDKRQDLILVVRGVVSVLAEDEDEAAEEISLEEPNIVGAPRGKGSYFGVDEFIGLRNSCKITLQAVVYTELSVLNRQECEDVLNAFPSLRDALDNYAAVRKEINVAMEDGNIDADELESLKMKMQEVRTHTDEPQVTSKYDEGEIMQVATEYNLQVGESEFREHALSQFKMLASHAKEVKAHNTQADILSKFESLDLRMEALEKTNAEILALLRNK